MRRLAHPIALGALALWIVNDQILKRACPGLVTGKLSDIAGMIVAPLALAAAIELVAPRATSRAKVAWTAFAIVGLAFALTKTWAPANEAFCSVLALLRSPARLVLERVHGATWNESVELVRDPTDLIAIPFGLISVCLGFPTTSFRSVVDRFLPRRGKTPTPGCRINS